MRRRKRTTMVSKLRDARRVEATEQIFRSSGGLTGPVGPDGRDAGFAFSFDTSTTMADPGAGDIRFNNGTIGSVTSIAISDTDDESNDLDGFLDTLDDSSSTVKGLLVISTSDGQIIVFEITAVTDQGTWHEATATYRSGTLPSNDEELKVLFVRTGDAGTTGAAGTDGRDGGTYLLWDNGTSAADPGSGHLRFNNATLASVTALYASDTDGDGNAWGAWQNIMDDSTSSNKGHIWIQNADHDAYLLCRINSAVTDHGDYHTLPVEPISYAGTFTDEEPISFLFTRTGDKGDTGATGATGATGPAGAGAGMLTPCRAATTANITTSTALNSGDSLDGVTLADGDRVLVKDQSTASQNGIWVVDATPYRATDADAAGELAGGFTVTVQEGTVNADTLWMISTDGSITPGTTSHSWARLGAKDYGLVTALPTSPTPHYGDRCTFIADNTNGVFWDLMYDGSGSYPWKKVGGPPLTNEVDTQQSKSGAATTYGDLATTGPDVTTPLAGDYIVEHGCHEYSNSAGYYGYMSYAVGGTGAADADATFMAGSTWAVCSRKRLKTAIAASTLIRCKYRQGTASQTVNFTNRWLSLDPVRVG